MLPSLIMLIAIVGLGFYAFRRMNNAMMNDTNKTLGFGKIRAKTLVEDEKRKTHFRMWPVVMRKRASWRRSWSS